MAFSLDHFEWLVHRHQNEEAAQSLMDLIRELDANFGKFPELGDYPSTGRQDPKNLRYVTRTAAAISSLFADESFQLSPDGFRTFAMAHRWLSAIFGASAFGTADHVIRAFNLEPNVTDGPFQVRDKDLLKFALLYSIDSDVRLDIDALWAKDRKMASALFMGILSSRSVVSDAAHDKREKLLEWFPDKLAQLQLGDLPGGFLHDVWMHCSYAVTPKKHEIKRVLNQLIRDEFMRSGFNDDMRDRSEFKREKPVIVAILDRFHSRHAVFRIFSRLLAGLRPKFRVVAICVQQPDAPAAELFDRVVVVPMENRPLAVIIREIVDAVHAEAPDIVFHLGVGMALQGIYLANLRLAPIQVASHAHPATTNSPFIDYFMMEDVYHSVVPNFSERALLVPYTAFIAIQPPKPVFGRTAGRNTGVVEIAVVATTMKFNPVFLRACREILDRLKIPARMHFLVGASYGVTAMYIDNLIRKIIPEAVVYPQMVPELYFQALSRADMCIDPFPFGNSTSYIDYASEGVPGITLRGDQIFSQMGSAVIRRLGLPDWLVANSVSEYVEKAIELASNESLRQSLSGYLKDAFQGDRAGSLAVFNGDSLIGGSAFEFLLANHGTIGANSDRVIQIG